MPTVITKFGGTSVSSKENWEHIVTITKSHLQSGLKPIIVCSALSQASNQLEKMIQAALLGEHEKIFLELQEKYQQHAKQLGVNPNLITEDFKQLSEWLTGIALLKEASPKIQAQILSLGELMLTKIGCAYLNQSGIKCTWLDAREIIIATGPKLPAHNHYLNAYADEKPNPNFIQQIEKSPNEAIITQGFIAANKQGETVLLGRGGSDTSAALFATILKATACEIWTDVTGMYSANPHQIPNARLLKQLNYDEAQEIASMGAKILHPHCISPVRTANIPMHVKCTKIPHHGGTKITQESDDSIPYIKSVQVKHNILLVSIDTPRMWQQAGFLADIFEIFKSHAISVDLLSSSECNVTVSLDNNTKIHTPERLNQLLEDLNQQGHAKLIEPCSAVSLVGRSIRTTLPKLGPVLEAFNAQHVHMMSLASNDLNLTFVVDESQADKLCQKLHNLLIESNPHHFYYSKTWQEEFGNVVQTTPPWWRKEAEKLLQQALQKTPCYFYNNEIISEKAKALCALQAVDRIFYAIKANPHPDILQALAKHQIGFECVSLEELKHARKTLPKLDADRFLFTPNFAAKNEYQEAISQQCYITIDSLYPLENWPELFENQKIILRIDPGSGAGHHKYVCTGGNESKFGINQQDIPYIQELVEKHNITVIGLHAHSGSGILTGELWKETALLLANLARKFPFATILNLGGGLGIVEKPGQTALDLDDLNAGLSAVKALHPRFELWLEPGRFFVAEAGVLLAKVTQCKTKGDTRFIGIETGMNSLLRPALYGSYHEIVNLTRLNQPNQIVAHIVGPICESGDTLGYHRLMPKTYESDILLIATAGAYGHCMGSSYNLRSPAKEYIS